MTGLINNETGLEIAVIGMSCHFPGARNTQEYWMNLLERKESISFFTKEQMLQAGTHPDVLSSDHHINASGILNNIDQFDAGFFGYTPREAELMDPQIRIYLQLCWEAIESSGYKPGDCCESMGLFVASRNNEYFFKNLYGSDVCQEDSLWQAEILNAPSSLATIVAYHLNLKGPAINLQTACSGSLVAIHQACRSILCGDCNIAIAGGVAIFLPQIQGRNYHEGMILSPDGHCRAFDMNAQGTVCSSGAGVVVLKRLSDAVKDGDKIQAIIKGSAVNNDGNRKVGFAAPSVEGQSNVISDAIQVSEVNVQDIGYIEAHGTGTKMGDPIEVEALTEAFGRYTNKKQFCALGSVKSNMGHTDAAAGVAGFIKVVLALKNKCIPAQVNFVSPNPNIDFQDTPFFINKEPMQWDKGQHRRIAGVSSFGIGGTNAHVILMDSDLYLNHSESSSKRYKLFCLSGKTTKSLELNTNNLISYLDANDVNYDDVAYTLQTRKRFFDYKRIVIGETKLELVQALESKDAENTFTGCFITEKKKIIFMFPGQGSQYVNMGKDLYEQYSEYKYWIDYCSEVLMSIASFDPRNILFCENKKNSDDEAIKDTFYAQVLLFMVEFSLAKLWIHFGLAPCAMIGHSIGEYVAACLSGVFSLEDALNVIFIRAKLMHTTYPGSMLAVSISSEAASKYLKNDLSIAAINTCNTCVISGGKASIECLKTSLENDGIDYSSLYTSQAFHSSLVDPILNEFEMELQKIRLQKPAIPFISCVSGTWISDMEATSPEYWTSHLRKTVNFVKGLGTVKMGNGTIYLEVGPGNQLATFARAFGLRENGACVLTSLPSYKEKIISTEKYFITTLGKLWIYGVNINFNNYYKDETRNVLELPTYAFDNEKYWIEKNKSLKMVSGEIKPVENWFYVPTWKQSPRTLAYNKTSERKAYLVFMEKSSFYDHAIKFLNGNKDEVIIVRRGEKFCFSEETGEFFVNPVRLLDYCELFNGLIKRRIKIGSILHFWNISRSAPPACEDLDSESQQPEYFSLLYLIQAFSKTYPGEVIQLNILVSNLYSVIGSENINYRLAVIGGITKVIQQEYTNVKSKIIDVDCHCSADSEREFLDDLFCQSSDSDVVAYRNNFRWTRVFSQLEVKNLQDEGVLKNRGVYVITGGLGNIGLLLSKYLAQKHQANIVLLGHSDFPKKKDWIDCLTKKTFSLSTRKKIEQLIEIDQFASSVSIYKAAIEDQKQLNQVVHKVLKKHGKINGVIHAAGNLSNGTVCQIKDVTTDQVSQQFIPKIDGALSIESVFSDINLDFCLLFSSLSSCLGGLGFSSYAAANAYLDAFGLYQSAKSNYPWVVVNFDGWYFGKNVGGNLFAVEEKKLINYESNDADYIFDKLFKMFNFKQLLICTDDLNQRYAKWAQSESYVDHGKNHKNMLYSRKDTLTKYVAPTSEYEIELVAIWQDLLGMDSIGVQDSFFELGGHSLIATQLTSRIRRKFGVDFPILSIFDSPTIRELSKVIESLLWVSKGEMSVSNDVIGGEL